MMYEKNHSNMITLPIFLKTLHRVLSDGLKGGNTGSEIWFFFKTIKDYNSSSKWSNITISFWKYSVICNFKNDIIYKKIHWIF